MDSEGNPLPPNPYIALGVAEDADDATIKSAYRKLCLKTHPDKFLDEEVKKQKQVEFQNIQQAYAILSDDNERRKYDEALKSARLARSKFKTPTGGSARATTTTTTSYGVRTAVPKGSNFAPPPHEERTPHRSASYDEDRYHEKRHESSSKSRTPPRSSRDKEKDSYRSSADRTRSDARKAQAREEKRSRSEKFASMEDESSSADDITRYEAQYRRQNRGREEDYKRHDSHRRTEERRSAEELPRNHRDNTHDKTKELEREALRHMWSTASREPRPTEYYPPRRSEPAPRRSAARPKDSARPTSSGRDRAPYPEIVDWRPDDDMERRVPPLPTTLKPSVSSPAEIRIPPARSYTEVHNSRRRDKSPTLPSFRRSETMPTMHTSSNSRRRDHSTSRHDSGYSSTTPEAVYTSVPLPKSSTKYYTPGIGSVRLAGDIEIVNGLNTVRREPKRESDRHRTRSPSPISRPPIGKHRTEFVKPVAPQPPRTTQAVPPPLGRASSSRDGLLYNEIPGPGYVHRAPAFVEPESVSYSRRYGPEDVHYTTGRGPERDRAAYTRPSLRKRETAAY